MKALLALGLLQGDVTLATAVLQEIEKLEERDDITDNDRVYLTALMLAVQVIEIHLPGYICHGILNETQREMFHGKYKICHGSTVKPVNKDH